MSKENLGLLLGICDVLATMSLFLIERAHKNSVWITAVLLAVMASLSLSTVYVLLWAWLWHPSLAERIWRVSLVTVIALLFVGRFGIWVWPQPIPQERVSDSEIGIKFLRSEQHQLSEFNQFAHQLTLIVALLRNDSIQGQRSDYAAHVVYLDANDNEVADMGRGLWLPSIFSSTMQFTSGITRLLTVFALNNGKLAKPTVRRQREMISAGHAATFADIRAEPFDREVTSVRIRLLTERREPITFRLTVQSSEGKISLVRRE